jgi:hypothetical protein
MLRVELLLHICHENVLQQIRPFSGVLAPCVSCGAHSDVTLVAEGVVDAVRRKRRESQPAITIRTIAHTMNFLVSRALLGLTLRPCKRAINVEDAETWGLAKDAGGGGLVGSKTAVRASSKAFIVQEMTFNVTIRCEAQSGHQ